MPRTSKTLRPAAVKAFFRVVTSTEARTQLALASPTTKREYIPVDAAAGRILAQPLKSRVNLPHFNRTNMDGYAVRAEDTFGASPSLPTYLKLVGNIEMGEAPKKRIGKGEAVRIATGGMLPPGANSMVMVEYTEELGNGTVEISRRVAPWENILRTGEDIQKHDEIFPTSRRFRPQDIGALTGVGITKVPVFKHPKVALISTGDEIVAPEQNPRPGQIRNVNQYSLKAMITECGGVTKDLGVIKDDPAAFRRAMTRALRVSDVTVVSGGSSVGIKDMALEVISSFPRSKVYFHGISIAPGKPTIFAQSLGKPVLGLPGHPVSALVVFALFGGPLIRMMGGESSASAFLPARTVTAYLTTNIPSAQGREDYVRVMLGEKNGVRSARPLPGKSGAIFSLVQADGMVCIPQNQEGREAGETVEVILF